MPETESSLDQFEYTLTRRAIRQIKAEAWDEGFDAGHMTARAVNDEWPDETPNPHRTTEAQR